MERKNYIDACDEITNPQTKFLLQATINRIHDDFESRTCENCKYHADINKSYKKCLELGINTSNNFSCNIWESKNANEKTADQ